MTDPQFACPLRKPGSHKHHNQQHSSSKHGTFRNSWRKKDSDHKGVKKMVRCTLMAIASLYTTSTLTLAMLFQMEIGMVEFVGLIKVDIIRGTNLAVRDVMSSDPYVMIILGHQVRTLRWWI
jgi:stromal membrane-associated protein